MKDATLDRSVFNPECMILTFLSSVCGKLAVQSNVIAVCRKGRSILLVRFHQVSFLTNLFGKP
jgi:hypothetical protein